MFVFAGVPDRRGNHATRDGRLECVLERWGGGDANAPAFASPGPEVTTPPPLVGRGGTLLGHKEQPVPRHPGRTPGTGG